MQPASEALRRTIDAASITLPEVPVIGNTTAQPLTTIEDIRAELTAQPTGSVRWTASMHFALAAGIPNFVEIGPGDVLSSLVRRIERSANRQSVSNVAGIEQFVQKVQSTTA